jgi:hypothetical protein
MTALGQQTKPAKPNRWTLRAAEICDLLRDAEIEPWLGSPFMHLTSPTKGSAPSSDTQDTPEVRKALTHIARPDIVLGLLHYPPETPDVTWFYGVAGDQHFAAYRQEDDNHHIVWPVGSQTLVQLLETALAIDQPAVTDGFSLSLDRSAFETLTVIVDIIQEGTLLAALNRQPPPQPKFDADDLFKCYKRNLRGIDLRWMVQRAKLLSPVPLTSNLEKLNQGIEYFGEYGLLTREGDLYSPTKRFNTACTLLSACIGFCALSTRRHAPQPEDDSVWDLQHVAALRGIGSLWLFEFTNVTSTNFSLKLGDITSSLLHERLQAGFISPTPQTAPPPIDSPAKDRICQNCGTRLKPNTSFCSKCGAKVSIETSTKKPQPASPPVADTVTQCPKCGAPLPEGIKFCTKCGAPVKGGKQ